MKTNYIFNMKKIFFLLVVFSMTFTSCEDFLDEDPSIGLSPDKLTDLASMNALVHGAYDNMRGFYAYQPMIKLNSQIHLKLSIYHLVSLETRY